MTRLNEPEPSTFSESATTDRVDHASADAITAAPVHDPTGPTRRTMSNKTWEEEPCVGWC